MAIKQINIEELRHKISIAGEKGAMSAHQSCWGRLCLPTFDCFSSAKVTQGKPDVLHEFRRIGLLMRSLSNYSQLFKRLEDEFVEFLGRYFSDFQDRFNTEAVEFSYWLMNDDKGVAAVFPVPSQKSIADAQHWKAENALVLFCYQQLLKLGYLLPDRNIDESLYYCMGFADPKEMKRKMTDHQLFMEAGPVYHFAHSKYAHLFQLILTEYANQAGIIKLNYPASERVALLVSDENKIEGRNGWNHVYDSFQDNTLMGPFAINIMLLSNQYLIWLQKFLRFSYIKKLIEQVLYDLKRPEANKHTFYINKSRFVALIRAYLQRHEAGSLGSKPLQPDYWQPYAKRYLFGEVESVSEHQVIFHKNFALRSAEFQRIAAQIAHENIPTNCYNVQPPAETTPLLCKD